MKVALAAIGLMLAAITVAVVYQHMREKETLQAAPEERKFAMECSPEESSRYLDYYRQTMQDLVASTDLISNVILSEVIFDPKMSTSVEQFVASYRSQFDKKYVAPGTGMDWPDEVRRPCDIAVENANAELL